jgi:FlaA1/EpsC-like NDP-sugar epimerase
VVCDVKDSEKIRLVMEQYKPDIVFHAAAYKHVPLMEYYPEEALRTNVMGTHSVLKAAIDCDVSKCIVISTDKAVNPTNVMGATKRMAELIGSSLSTSKTEIVSVRFGNVLGSRGSMLPLFFDQIKRGLPITVTHKDIIRYFMTIPEAVSLVFLAGAIGKGGEVMVLDMGKPIKIYDFAQNLIKRFGDGRSTVIVTGLRPGEKLYEELLTKEDEVIKTSYDKVFKARVENGHDIEIIERFIQEIPASQTDDLLQTLGSYVPFPLAQKIQERREAYLS